jgi:hypothetical protein
MGTGSLSVFINDDGECHVGYFVYVEHPEYLFDVEIELTHSHLIIFC